MVLVVGVGVDDHVRAELEAGVQAGLEGAARPLLLVSRTMWSTPWARATSTVSSFEPSSIDQQLDLVEARDRARDLGERLGKLRSSLKQGIWMISFMLRAA